MELDPPAIEIVPENDPWNVLEIVQQNDTWSVLDIIPEIDLGIDLGSRDRSWDRSQNRSQERSPEREYAFSGSYFDPVNCAGIQEIGKRSS